MPLSRRTILAGMAVMSQASLAYAQASAQQAPEVINLWPGKPPGGNGPLVPEHTDGKGSVTNVAVPRLAIYRPAKPNGTAVMLAAGGGYAHIELGAETTPAAKWLQSLGITAYELIYRLPEEGWTRDAPFEDGQRAMRIIRSRSAADRVDPKRIGAMGFSAGGHLVAMTSVLPDVVRTPAIDAIDALPARPNFAVLLYPVITMLPPYNERPFPSQSRSKASTTHAFKSLFGPDATKTEEIAYSPEQHVDGQTPPLFLAQAEDDPISPVQNSKMMDAAAKAAHVPSELHLFATGGHGWGMGKLGSEETVWPKLCAEWMARGGFLAKTV